MGYRYIGSKEKLASTIIEIIQRACPDAISIIDLMAGTGQFSLALRKNGYQVTAADVMTYSYHHLVVNLLLNVAPNFNGLNNIGIHNYSEAIDYLNNVTPIRGYFSREFAPSGKPTAGCKSRKYFSDENAQKIDSVRQTIREWHRNSLITDVEHSLLIHDLIMATNDIANIAGTYGHYLSHFVQRSLSPILLRQSNIEECTNINHTVLKGYAEDLSETLTGDVCYIDPPYIKRQYAANYHVLETIAREDEPEAIGESGLRPWRDQYSNFCSKIKIRQSLNDIITNIRCNHFFISYSEDGLLPINTLSDILKQYGTVEIYELKYKRFKSNKSSKSLFLTEYLIHLNK